MEIPRPVLRSVAIGAAFYALGWAVFLSGGALWDGLTGIQPARFLARHGSAATADRVEVRLDVGRGLYVAEVRVWMSATTRPVSLSDIQPPETALDDADPSPPTGWQAPSPLTGYVPPFPVRYAVDSEGVVTAMADSDLVDQGSYIPILGGLGGVLGGGAGAYLWYRFVDRRGWVPRTDVSPGERGSGR